MNNDFFKSYQTAEWQRKKNAVLERDNYTCQICGDKSGLMQVHHITYKHCRGKAYNAPMGDLITLCEECHRNDDGDHKHFYNGEVTLSRGYLGNKPQVFGTIKTQNYWEWPIGVIIAFQYCGQPYWNIGFRSCGDWFPYVLGIEGIDYLFVCSDHDPAFYNVQRLATIEETTRLVDEIGGDFGDLVTIHYFGDEVLCEVDLKRLDEWEKNDCEQRAKQQEEKTILLRSRKLPNILLGADEKTGRIFPIASSSPRIMVNVKKL